MLNKKKNEFLDAQMFQRAPRHKFERLDFLNIMMMLSLKTDFGSPKKKCGAISSLLPLWDDHNAGQKKAIRNDITLHILTLSCVFSHWKRITFYSAKFTGWKCITLLRLSMLFLRGDAAGIRPTKITSPGNLSDHFETGRDFGCLRLKF